MIDGQVRCITPEVKPQSLQVIWNVQFVTVFVPAWMIPPVYHSLRREFCKSHRSPVSPSHLVRRHNTEGYHIFITSRPSKGATPATTWTEVSHQRRGVNQGMTNHNSRRLSFWLAEACEHLTHGSVNVLKSASKQLLMSHVGYHIEQNGDGLLEDSHMPVGWSLHIDGAVRQCCIQELLACKN